MFPVLFGWSLIHLRSGWISVGLWGHICWRGVETPWKLFEKQYKTEDLHPIRRHCVQWSINSNTAELLRMEDFFDMKMTICMDIWICNPPACRRVLWILLVRSCTVCLVFCLCLDFPLGADFCLVELQPTPPSSSSSSSSGCSSSSFAFFCHDVLGSTLPTTRSTRAWFWTCLLLLPLFLSAFFAVFATGLLCRVICPILAHA